MMGVETLQTVADLAEVQSEVMETQEALTLPAAGETALSEGVRPPHGLIRTIAPHAATAALATPHGHHRVLAVADSEAHARPVVVSVVDARLAEALAADTLPVVAVVTLAVEEDKLNM